MDKIIIIDFGSQYTQLIARKIRELEVFCEVIPYQSYDFYNIHEYNLKYIKGMILSGGPDSVVLNEAYKRIYIPSENDIPILGICYGAQLLVKEFGGVIVHKKDGEYGNTTSTIINSNEILKNIDDNFSVWMSHNDTITELPENWNIISKTENDKISVFNYNNIYGVQFHPEVSHTTCGNTIFDNFLKICNCSRSWTNEHFIKMSITSIKKN